MHETFKPDNIAVITGAASGIGRAMAIRCAEAGMRVMLVDINNEKLAAAEQDATAAAGGNAANIAAAVTDVGSRDAMLALARRVETQWGAPHFLMNNAALMVHGGPGGILDPIENWHRTFEVGVWGVINGVTGFLPGMLAHGERGVIVNTGSKQGITLPPGNPCYNTVKSAVNAYSQCLAHDLRNRDGAKLSAHLLVPGWTTTGDQGHKPGAWKPYQVVSYLLDALERDDFWVICPDDETSSEMDRKRIRWHGDDMVRNRPALSRWHPDYAEAFAAHMRKPLDD